MTDKLQALQEKIDRVRRMRVRLKPRIVDAELWGTSRWYVDDPILGHLKLEDADFREVFENEFDHIELSPRDLTAQLSGELQRWGMTPLDLDAPVTVTLSMALAAVRQITFDIKQIAKISENRDVTQELEELVK